MGGDHHGPPKVPDYKIYKVEEIPELMKIKRMLAQEGLKDPWLRNEVWRYPQEYTGGIFKTLHPIYFSGFKYGLAACVLTIIGEKIYHHFYPKEQHGHH